MTKAHFSHFLTIAATATALSVVLSLLLVKNHLQHYTRPRLQKYTVRIVLMVPIYAVDSLLSLLMPEYSSVMNAMREIYEAFVIYTFLNLLIAYSGGEPLLVAIFLDKPTLKHPKPFDQCIASYTPNAAFLRTCKQGILQYVFIKPLTGLIALLLSFWGLYGDGEILFHKGYVYLTFINNISVSVSFFFYGTLIDHNPFSCLLAISYHCLLVQLLFDSALFHLCTSFTVILSDFRFFFLQHTLLRTGFDIIHPISLWKVHLE
eukprot:TRINITY_DN704_c0_g1_i2.p1 TRINITY_DN704_c0_g1~~TRINITY_DN704_c0_g1_i2.p1  ORF type:complete len:262 (-),score=23.06 TRINITY_DN704_c0_g1_i2:20-805(-)